MNKLNAKSWWLVAVLFTLNGAIVSDASDALGTAVKNVQFDTLCLYSPLPSLGPTVRHFQNEAQLTRFLDSTGYLKPGYESLTLKKIAHRPDFEKWTYFGFVQKYIEHTVDISHGKDTVTINITLWNHFYKCESPPCPAAAPPAYKTVVYFIPFTKKTIVLSTTNRDLGGNK